MEYENLFYLPNLLRIKDLNTRETAVLNGGLTAAQYFDMLAEFLKSAPNDIYALNSIEEEHSVKQNEKFITGIKAKLEKIGALDFAVFIDKALKEGVTEESVHAVSIRLAALYDRVKKLHNVPLMQADTGMYENEYTSLLENSMNSVIEHLAAENDRRKLRIMAVDDATVMLQSITSMLGDRYKVYTLTKPLLADMLLTHFVPELFLLDYKMPEMSGFDLIPVIRAYDEHKETPVIIMTATGTEKNFHTAIQLGACDFIVKPFDNSEVLIQKIEKHIRRKTFF